MIPLLSRIANRACTSLIRPRVDAKCHSKPGRGASGTVGTSKWNYQNLYVVPGTYAENTNVIACYLCNTVLKTGYLPVF